MDYERTFRGWAIRGYKLTNQWALTLRIMMD